MATLAIQMKQKQLLQELNCYIWTQGIRLPVQEISLALECACYYQPEDYNSSTTRTVYRALYAVYRKMSNVSSNSDSYVKVSDPLSAVVATSEFTLSESTRDQHIAEGFNCYDDALDNKDSTAFLTIEEGDIIGACVLDPDNLEKVERLQLDIVGEESGHSLMQTSADDCKKGLIAIPSAVSADQLTVLSSRKLHIYANIICKFSNKFYKDNMRIIIPGPLIVLNTNYICLPTVCSYIVIIMYKHNTLA